MQCFYTQVIYDISSWTMISFSAEGQSVDIKMMEILSSWLYELIDEMRNLCTGLETYM